MNHLWMANAQVAADEGGLAGVEVTAIQLVVLYESYLVRTEQ